MIKNEKDLDLKYVVFKINDVNDFLTDHERELFWSFLNKIIVSKGRIIENEISREKADELCIKQFKYDINQLSHKVDSAYLKELISKYNI